MAERPKLQFHVDYASRNRLVGWALDASGSRFPAGLVLRGAAGRQLPFASIARVARPDLATAFALADEHAVGFDINLVDLFNDRPADYDVMLGSRVLWSYAGYIEALARMPATRAVAPERSFGTRQLAFLFESGGYFAEEVQRLHGWNKHYFRKEFQAGTSFAFIPVNELTKCKKELLARAAGGVVFIEARAFPQVFRISPTLVANCNFILLERQLDFSVDFSGQLRVLAGLAGLEGGQELGAVALQQLFSTAASYGALLFDAQNCLYTFQSGTPQPWMREFMREQVQERASEDLVLLGETPPRRLAELEAGGHAVFVRTGALRQLLDILALDGPAFVREALRRGARVRAITREAAHAPADL